MRFIFILSALLIAACSTPPKSLSPTVNLMNTNKAPQELIPDLRAKFEENKYQVSKENAGVGLLAFKPRGFSVGALRAQQIVQMRQEGGSLKLRIMYRCNYQADIYEDCSEGDPELVAKMNRLDSGVQRLIKSELVKERERVESTSIGEINPEEEK